MKRRVKAAVLTLCVAGTLVAGPATPAKAAVCDELTQVYCTVMGTVCYALYKLHVTHDPGCIA
jgi:hypothetical protein